MDDGIGEDAVIGSNKQCSAIQPRHQLQQQQFITAQQHQSSLFNKETVIQSQQVNDHSISMEVLLTELHELKNQVTFLQNENASLIQFRDQMLTECSITQELKSQLEVAESEIMKLQDLTERQRAHISSLQSESSSTSEGPRKSAKRFQDERHISGNVGFAHNKTNINLQPCPAPTPVADNNHSTNFSNIGDSNSTAAPGANTSISGGGISNSTNTVQTLNRKKVIQVIDTNLQTVKEKIKATNCENFTLHQNSRSGPIKIAITNSTEIPKIRDSLVNSSLSFHEYKWQEEKWRCFVLRGLFGASTDDIPYIKQELLNAGLPNSIILEPLFTGYMRAHPGASHNSLFKLIVPPNFDVKVLLGIKYLDHVAVKFETLKKNKVMQCKNCQRFGHSASGCQHPHRCVKCGEDHYRDNCPRTHNKASKLKCCNCGGEHTANNVLKCQFYLQRYAKNGLNDSATINKVMSNNTKRAHSSAVTPGVSFAQVIGNRRVSENQSGNSFSQKAKESFKQNVLVNSTSANIEQKIDMLIQLVSRHDVILQNLINNG